MEFSDIVAVTGLPGLYRVVNKRQDGMIVSDLKEDKPRFVSARVHMFTPLENITIFTEDDPIDLRDVLIRMKEKSAEVPPVGIKASRDEMRTYFETVVPEHDKERVYASDIKKVLKWYAELDEQGVLESMQEPEAEQTGETEEDSGDAVTEEKAPSGEAEH